MACHVRRIATPAKSLFCSYGCSFNSSSDYFAGVAVRRTWQAMSLQKDPEKQHDFLFHLYKWKREIHKSAKEILISLGDLPISLADLYISLRDIDILLREIGISFTSTTQWKGEAL